MKADYCQIRDSFDGELRMAGEKIASAEADAAAQDAAFQQAEEALEQAKRTKQEAEAERNRMQDEKKELKDNSDAAKGELQDLQVDTSFTLTGVSETNPLLLDRTKDDSRASQKCLWPDCKGSTRHH